MSGQPGCGRMGGVGVHQRELGWEAGDWGSQHVPFPREGFVSECPKKRFRRDS